MDFVLECSCITWKNLDPFEACFYAFLVGQNILYYRVNFVPVLWQYFSEWYTQGPIYYEFFNYSWPCVSCENCVTCFFPGYFPQPQISLYVWLIRRLGKTADLWSCFCIALSSLVSYLWILDTLAFLNSHFCSPGLCLVSPSLCCNLELFLGSYMGHLWYHHLIFSHRVTVLHCLHSVSKNHCILFVHFFNSVILYGWKQLSVYRKPLVL